MAELAIIASIALLGYSFSKGKKNPRNPDKIRETVPLNEDPYVNKKLKDVIKTEQTIADERFEKAKDPYNKNVIIGSFLSPEIMVDQSRTIIPLAETQDKLLEKYKYNGIGNIVADNNINSDNYSSFEPFSVSPSLTGPNGQTGLSGEKPNYTHNNMVPFFGGNLKGNSIPDNSLIVEQHTGVQNRWKQPKKEVERFTPLYKEEVNGNRPFQDIVERDRFIQSNKKNGVLPFPQERTHYIDPEFVRPQFRSVDNLRVKQKDRVEYKGRVVSGQMELQRASEFENFNRNHNDITSSKNIIIPTSSSLENRPRVYKSQDGNSIDSYDSREVCKESYEGETRNLGQTTRGNTLPLNEDIRNTTKQTTHSEYIGSVGASDKNIPMSREGKYITKEKNAESTQYDGKSYSQYNSILKNQISRKQYQNRQDRTDKECLLENRVPSGYLDKSSDSSTVKLSRFGNREDENIYIPQGNAPIPERGDIGTENRNNCVTNADDQSAQRIADASLIVKQLDNNIFSIK